MNITMVYRDMTKYLVLSSLVLSSLELSRLVLSRLGLNYLGLSCSALGPGDPKSLRLILDYGKY